MSIVLGDKNSFGIEVEEKITDSPLRLWVNAKAIGDFKKKDELIDSFQNLKSLVENIETLYEDSFKDMTPYEIFNWILSMQTQEDLEKRRRYIRFLGEQMDNISMFSYLKDDLIEWCFYNQKTKKIRVEKIEKAVIIDVCNQYFEWFETKKSHSWRSLRLGSNSL